MRISDWSSDVCSSDLCFARCSTERATLFCASATRRGPEPSSIASHNTGLGLGAGHTGSPSAAASPSMSSSRKRTTSLVVKLGAPLADRSEEHTSELQSLMRNSYAVFCLKKKKYASTHTLNHIHKMY